MEKGASPNDAGLKMNNGKIRKNKWVTPSYHDGRREQIIQYTSIDQFSCFRFESLMVLCTLYSGAVRDL